MLVLDEYKMQLGALNETLALAHKQMNADALSEELKTLRTELESVREELTRLEHERFLLSRGVPEEDVDYYNFKIGKLPGAKDDFAKAAKEYLKAHPVKRASVSSGAELSGGGSRKPETSSELMNHLLRNH